MRVRAAAIAHEVRTFLSSRLGPHPKAAGAALSAGWCLAASAFLVRRLEESGIPAQVVHGTVPVVGEAESRPHAFVRCPRLALWIDITGDQFGHAAVRLMDDVRTADPHLLVLDGAELQDLLAAEESMLDACEAAWRLRANR